MSDPQTRVVGNPGGYQNDTKSMMAGLLGSAPPSDLTPEQIEENKRLVEERLAREAAESQAYLRGEKTLGPSYIADEDVEVVGSGQQELPSHEVKEIEALTEEIEENAAKVGIPVEPLVEYPSDGK